MGTTGIKPEALYGQSQITMSHKRKRTVFSINQKQEIICYQDKHPNASHQTIADHFATVWGVEVKRRTVGDIIQQRDKWLSLGQLEPAAKRQKTAKHTDLEQALWLWFSNFRAQNGVITDDILRAKAKKFGAELGISDFSYSNGWLHRFKQRHNISSHTLCGESAGVDPQLITDGQTRGSAAVRDYQLKDVFNMDETGIFYRMTPDRSLTTSDKTKGTKKLKERITVVLTCNADGSEKLRPLVIGRANKPRCFKNFNHKLYVDYDYNKKAWMTSAIFAQWLMDLNNKMKRQQRHILLILDNAPGHIIPDGLTNVKVHFLPPTTTSHLQPLDAGIICNFKSHFRKQQLNLIVEQIDNTGSHKIEVSDAIRFIKHAWDSVTPTTIVHCWQHTGLVPRDTAQDNDLSPREDEDDDLPLAELGRRATSALNIDPERAMTVEDFLQVDQTAEVFADMTDDSIINLVKDSDSQNPGDDVDADSDSDDAHSQPPPPTTKDATAALVVLLRYVECNDLSEQTDLDMVLTLQKRLIHLSKAKAKQLTVKDFFKMQ